MKEPEALDKRVKAAPSEANLSAFRGKRVFVTGHTGFKGSWLGLWLSELGADVTGYALKPAYEKSHFDLLGLRERLHHIEGDIRDAEKLHAAMEAARPEIVFHLAAQALVRPSYTDPLTTFGTNAYGSACLLDAVRRVDGIRALIFATSDKCYLNKEWAWSYRETDELGGHDPYSASKAAAENVYLGYYHSFLRHRAGLGSATVRAGNVVGGGDWAADRLVPDTIRALESAQAITLRNPSATRPWQFVLEPLGGYMTLALRLTEAPDRFAGSWNFGPLANNVRTVDQISRRIVQRWGSGEIRHDPQGVGTAHEAMLLQLSIDKIAHYVGWQPVYSVEECIDETVAWYRARFDGADVPELSRSQLRRYMQAAADRAGAE
jgi:CDP-glucose 4,6-dehydratase